MVVNNVNSKAFVLRNNSENSNFLKVCLKGSQLNRFGLGSDITIYQKGKLQKHHHAVTRGYASSVDYDILFGLGENREIDSLEIV